MVKMRFVDATSERMIADSDIFATALAAIDLAHAGDPSRVILDGREYPAELLYATRMSEWLARLEPQASEALRLAVRCQHLRRWEIPRATYPMDRAGYHRWRTRLAHFHAQCAAEILQGAGYDVALVHRVQSLIRKESLRSDPEAQTLEDVACLVFLETEYVDFAGRQPEPKVIDILRKTWRKMSMRGRAAALEVARSLPSDHRALIESALNSESAQSRSEPPKIK
jgi:hypothetical protein